MARLTAAQRKAAPHAGPGNSFPIPDVKHARLALAMAGHAANPAEVRAKVHARYPEISSSGSFTPAHQSKSSSSSMSSGKVNTAGNSGPGSTRALSPTGKRAGDNNSRGHRL